MENLTLTGLIEGKRNGEGLVDHLSEELTNTIRLRVTVVKLKIKHEENQKIQRSTSCS